ncbi:MAG: hypothetical protein AAF587_29650 [Bacteroidota bacterium]
MKRQDINIEIGQYEFGFAHALKVESSWENLTDVATIQVPRKLAFNGKAVAQGDSLFRKGDRVTVKVGYDSELDTIFEGNVSAIKPLLPMAFDCQDDMWLLKQSNFNLSYKSATIKQILSDISPIPFQSVDGNLGPFRISDVSGAQVLQELRRVYGLHSFIRSGTLFCGLAYWGDGATHTFKFGHHIIEEYTNLEYLKKEDIRLAIKAVSILPNNQKIEVKVGDDGGEVRTLPFLGMDQAQLTATAEKHLEKFRIEGYKGSFSTFGQPSVMHGDTVELIDDTYPDRNGKYLVKSVRYSAGVNGYRQKIELDQKV